MPEKTDDVAQYKKIRSEEILLRETDHEAEFSDRSYNIWRGLPEVERWKIRDWNAGRPEGRVCSLLAAAGFPIPDPGLGFTPKVRALVQQFVDEITRALLESHPPMIVQASTNYIFRLFVPAGITEELTIPPCQTFTRKGNALVGILREYPEAWATLVTTSNRAVAVRFAAERDICTATLGNTTIANQMCRQVVELLDARGDRRGL